MIIETKYNLEQKVWGIVGSNIKQNIVTCEICKGTGRIFLKENREYSCPECYGKGQKIEYIQKYHWYISTKGSIGKIICETISDRYSNSARGGIKYMLDSTGVGSGTLWPEENLFSSEYEAEKECEKRNEGEKEDE